MAYLDVTSVLSDPMLASRFTVRRRPEVVGDSGVSQVGEQRFTNLIGVVQNASPSDLRRLPEDQRMERHLSVITTFRLRGPSPGFQPDVVEWDGSDYVVSMLEPYANFGPGFVQAICGSMTTIDPPTPEGNDV